MPEKLQQALEILKVAFTGWCPACRRQVDIVPRSVVQAKTKGDKITTKSAKQKARRAQEAAAKLIKDAYDLNDEDVRPVSMGQPGADLILSEKARKYWPFHAVEVTANTRVSLPAKFKQAEKHAEKQTSGKQPGNGRPILIFKKNSGQLFVMIRLSDLLAALTGRI